MSEFREGVLSRRSFLKGSLASLAGTAGLMALGPTVFADETEEKTAGTDAKAEVEKSYRIYETDVVVVGGGLSGLMAAYSAKKEGVNVLLVDKGPFGHSGASGINWGTWLNVAVSENFSVNAAGSGGMADQKLENTIARAANEFDPLELGTKAGSVYGRTPEGYLDGYNMEYNGMKVSSASVFMPRLFAHYVRNLGVKVLDRTMITDVMTADDGSACGVIGLDIRNGVAVIVRAKAVVMAMGSSCWLQGWKTAGAMTVSGKECTGDGIGILLRHGQKIRNFENQYFYGYNAKPDGIAYGSTIGVQSSDHPYNVINTKGEYFLKKWAEVYPELAENMNLNNYFAVIMAEREAGNLTEDDTYFLDISDIDSPEWKTFNRGKQKEIEEAFGIDLGDKLEIGLCAYTTPYRPELDAETCETMIPGLYYANEMEDSGSLAGFCAITGHLSGKNAAETAKGAKIKAPREEDAVAAIEEIYDVFTRRENTGKRPIEIQHMIQQLVHEKAFYLTDEDGLNEAIRELQRIREEEIPSMKLVDGSRVFNLEWQQALEVNSMWLNAMGMAVARLNRRETRGSHFRRDYPHIDNEHYLKNQYISQKDGEFTSEFTDIVALSMNEDVIKAAMLDLDRITDEIRNQG